MGMVCNYFLLAGCAFLASFQTPLFASQSKAKHKHLDPVSATHSCSSSLLLGATVDAHQHAIQFRVYSKHATALEVMLFSDATSQPILSRALKPDAHTHIWSGHVTFTDLAKAGFTVDPKKLHFPFYSYRAWGPNWPQGSTVGLDFDSHGNRFNPNKSLIDPYALEISHDPRTQPADSEDVFMTGNHRDLSSIKRSPKGLILPFPKGATSPRPERPAKDEVIYEMHVRGFSMLAPGVPQADRGTFRGVVHLIPYLQELGVTAIELLPVFEFSDDANQEQSTDGNNYWGYDPMSFFAPNRRFASPPNAMRPGGAIDEFTEMAEALHAADIKLYLDVVYNHTAEGGSRDHGKKSKLLSWRGLDNRTYYQVGPDGGGFQDNTGCGANVNTANSVVRDQVLDSQKYWHHLGVDGFRYDLASVLGNTRTSGYDFHFDKMDSQNIFNRAIRELPARPEHGGPGVDLFAEPWGVGPGTYQLGHFPHHHSHKAGMAEWNGAFRDTLKRAENKWGISSPTPGEMAARLSGSADLFSTGMKGPTASVNYVVSHDGPTLKDLVSFNERNNHQGYPYGPTDGGDEDSMFWDHAEDGDSPEVTEQRQRQAARNLMALTMLAYGGIPLFYSGDEVLRTQNANNNAYKIDSAGTWFPWPQENTFEASMEAVRDNPFFQFTKNLIGFRRHYRSLRPERFAKGVDTNHNGLRDLSWYQANGKSAVDADLPDREKGYMADAWNGFLAMRIDAEEHGDAGVRSIYVAYNWSHRNLRLHLPAPAPGKQWHWQGDTHRSFEKSGNFMPTGKSKTLHDVLASDRKTYPMHARTVAVFVER
jgi:isoamylase